VRRDPLTGTAARAAGLAGLLAAACAAGPARTGQGSPAATAGEITVAVATGAGTDRRFLPAAVAVPAGTRVRLVFRNDSSESHNLSFTGALETVRTPTIMDPGQEAWLAFVAPDPGVYPFVCTVHLGMAGELRVSAVGAAAAPRP
jgi:plastocyanin